MPRPKTSALSTISKESLQKIANNCCSLQEVLNALGYQKRSGGIYMRLKSRLEEDDIDLSTLQDNFRNKKREESCKMVNSDQLLVENSVHANKMVRRYILRERLIQYKCHLCQIGSLHNGLPLTLQLDHINGVSNDHRLPNLRFLCPNCHSQTSNWGGRNVKRKAKQNTCIDCGESISKTSVRCMQCVHKEFKITRTKFNVDPGHLKYMILEKQLAYSTIGKMFGVSYTTVKKHCSALGIASLYSHTPQDDRLDQAIDTGGVDVSLDSNIEASPAKRTCIRG